MGKISKASSSIVHNSLWYKHKFLEIRKHTGLSQDAFAEKLGISGSAIGLIEQGKTKSPSAELLVALTRVLGVNLDWLLLGEGEMLKPTHLITAEYTDKHRYDRLLNGTAKVPERLDFYKDLINQAEEELGKTPGAYCSRKAAIRAMELLETMLHPTDALAEKQQLAATPENWKQIVAQIVDELMSNQAFLTGVASKIKVL